MNGENGGGLGLPVRLEARLHARVVDGAGLAGGVEAHGAFLAEAMEDDGAIDEGAEEGASVGEGGWWLAIYPAPTGALGEDQVRLTRR